MLTKINQLLTFSLLLFGVGITLGCYWAGLDSAFLFDDVPNMNTIGRYAHLGSWRDLALYLLDGNSGALGRPLSLASFYLNDQTWQGMNRADFKYTNLMIHLLNGVLIFWLCERLLRYLPMEDKWLRWLPPLASIAWLLHPIHINTVLYAVQRMTELSTLFTLTGLLCYLQGREKLATQPKQAWLWLLCGGGLSVLFALLSKENGILTVVYVLVIEYVLIRPHGHSTPKPLTTLLLWCAWLPLALLGIMLLKWGWVDQTSRPFTTVERLLTESRILWDYLYHILIPHFNGNSLLHDDIEISRSLISPLTTLPALLGILGLGFGAWLVRKRLPILSFAIFWFFAGHLLESTTIALELYFEHRNYLPLFGILFALVYYTLYGAQQTLKLRHTLPIALAIYLGLMAISTYHIAQRWTDSTQLVISWLEEHPDSQRTLEALDSLIGGHISPHTRQQLLEYLQQIASTKNSASYLVFRNLKLACEDGSITPEQLPRALDDLRNSPFIPPLPEVLANFVHAWTETHCGGVTSEQMVSFLNDFRNIVPLQKGDMPHILHYWQAEVHVQQGNLAEAMQHFDQAYALDKNIDLLLLQASYLMSAGLYTEADSKLANAEQDFCTNWRSCLTLKLRQPDMDNLRSALQDKLKQEKANNHAQAINYSARQE